MTTAANDDRTLFHTVRQWVENWRRGQAALADLDACGSEAGRMLHELGVTRAELARMAANDPRDAALLPRMLDALAIGAEDLARTSPALMRDLERTCALCDSKGECRSDLDAGQAEANWQRYCVNAQTLEALRA